MTKEQACRFLYEQVQLQDPDSEVSNAINKLLEVVGYKYKPTLKEASEILTSLLANNMEQANGEPFLSLSVVLDFIKNNVL